MGRVIRWSRHEPALRHGSRTREDPPMAEIDIQRDVHPDPEPDYTVGEMILWLVGILAIPLVPILMIWFFTPWSGM